MKTTNSKKMNQKWYSPGFIIPCVAGMSLCVSSLSAQEESEEIFELSPFSVDAGDSNGYQATNTMAGSRLKTPLKDIGSAIQIITAQLFEDTGATTMEEILPYALNMESNGALGNFADGPGQNHNGRFEQDSQRLNPQGSQRVRGLASASLTRDFFLTDIPFESYNTQRIAISRGANSLLFGIGSPGGIINNTTKRANVDGEEFNELSIRIGERGSHRESFDTHQVIIEDRLSIRLMGLYKDTVYQQNPAFETDRRITGSMDAVLFENEGSEFFGKTKFRGNFEGGSLKGTPPNLTPPNDAFSSFFTPPNIAQLQSVPGVVIPAYYLGAAVGKRSHPEFGYASWQPKQTFDNRVGVSRGNVPSVAERNAGGMKIKFNADSNIPIAQGYKSSEKGITGTVDADGFPVDQGSATHVIGVDGNPYKVLSKRWDELSSGSFFMGNRNGQRIPNFTTPVILDRNVWDNDRQMIQGLTNFRNQEFDTETFSFEQPMLNGDLGFEFAWDNQHWEQDASIPFSENETIGDNHNNDVVIDLNEYISNGELNPNVGRPHMKTDEFPGNEHRSIDRESVRATLFANIDFERYSDGGGWMKHLGKHTITAFYNKQDIDFFERKHDARLLGQGFNLGAPQYFNSGGGANGLRSGSFKPVYEVYLGPDVRGLSGPGDVQLSPIGIDTPALGSIYDVSLWNKDTESFDPQKVSLESVLVSGSRRRNEIETEVISIQSRFLDDHIVGLVGWRGDEATTWENIGSAEADALGITQDIGGGPNNPRNPDYFRLSEGSTTQTGDTVTWSVVGHVPDEWTGDTVGVSLHMGESENFQVSPTRRDVRGTVLSPPVGTTEEYGVTFSFMQNKLIARLNWFESTAAGASRSGGTAFGYFGWVSSFLGRWEESSEEFGKDEAGFQQAVQASSEQLGPSAGNLNNPSFQTFEDVYGEIISWLPSDIQALRMLAINPATGEVTSEANPGETSTQDFVTKGFEVDLTANLTDNWRVFMNIGQQESVVSNIALPVRAVSQEILANIQSSPIGQWADTPLRSEGQTFESRFFSLISAPLGAIASQDGQLAKELREWRVNLVTSYSFKEGLLKGFTAGGGVRWQDGNAIGYPNLISPEGQVVPDLERPFMGPEQLNGDIFMSYNRPIWDDKVDWKIQFNFRNAFGDNDPIPVAINPDGNVAVIRNAQQKTLFLTNTFSF